MPIGVKILQGSSTKNSGKLTSSHNSNPNSLNPILIFHNAKTMMPIWAPMTIGSVFMIGGVFLSTFVLSNKILFTILHGVFLESDMDFVIWLQLLLLINFILKIKVLLMVLS